MRISPTASGIPAWSLGQSFLLRTHELRFELPHSSFWTPSKCAVNLKLVCPEVIPAVCSLPTLLLSFALMALLTFYFTSFLLTKVQRAG